MKGFGYSTKAMRHQQLMRSFGDLLTTKSAVASFQNNINTVKAELEHVAETINTIKEVLDTSKLKK